MLTRLFIIILRLCADRRGRMMLAAALGLLLCTDAFLLRGGRIDDHVRFKGDSVEYQSLAVNMLNGHPWRYGAVLPFEQYGIEATMKDDAHYDAFMAAGQSGGQIHFQRTPGYPVMLFLTYKAFGVRPGLAVRLQMLIVILIAVTFPLILHIYFGRPGFLSGLLGGLIFALFTFEYARVISAEALTAAALYLAVLLMLWYLRRPDALKALLVGASLGAAVLVNVTLLLLPLCFALLMMLSHGERGEIGKFYRMTYVLICLLAFAMPVKTYSRYATEVTGEPIMLSTGIRSMLLGGNNEYALATGGLEEQWREDASSFYRRWQQEHGSASAGYMAVQFYLNKPLALPLSLIRKVDHGFINIKLFSLLQVAAMLGFLMITARHDRAMGEYLESRIRQKRSEGMTMIIFALIAAQGSVAIFSLLFGILMFMYLRRYAELRRDFGSLLLQPVYAVTLSVLVNFLLMTMITYGLNRNVAPAGFLYYPVGLLLATSTYDRITLIARRVISVKARPEEIAS